MWRPSNTYYYDLCTGTADLSTCKLHLQCHSSYAFFTNQTATQLAAWNQGLCLKRRTVRFYAAANTVMGRLAKYTKRRGHLEDPVRPLVVPSCIIWMSSGEIARARDLLMM